MVSGSRSSQPQCAAPSRYLNTLLQPQVARDARPITTRFDDLAVRAEKIAKTYIRHLNLTFQGYSLTLCSSVSLSSVLSSLQVCGVVNRQGVVGQEAANSTDKTGDSTVNDVLFSVGASYATRTRAAV
jgi:hypothetical protein